MPRKPKRISDFDRKLGAVIEHRRLDPDHFMTQKELSEATDIPLSNLQRREAGVNEVTVSELERIAYHLGTTPAEMVKDALRRYGGLEKLIAEYGKPAVSDEQDNFDAIPYIGRVTPSEQVAAETNERAPGRSEE